ncbi:hypothetical protein O181_009587 [Austropuccinia psidii MF-1]|uniref:Uncharacterized protein n=1 Tax=Austropuccinia psidii MF-1 TaxID=1389203 RepID=A0A9Q3GKF9_9BASI|nr:hypothetical protein [Austropuccinia psidii MF-1]
MKALQGNTIFKIDYSVFGKDNHLSPFEGGGLRHITDDDAQLREAYARNNASRETALRTFEELKDACRKITVLVGNRLIRIAGLHSTSVAEIKMSTARSPGWRPRFFAKFAFLGINDKELDLTADLLSQEMSLPQQILTEVHQKAPAQMMKQLNGILHSLNFSPKDDEALDYEMAERLETQVLFETCTFQALDFMYKNDLCDETVLRTFFSAGDTFEKLYEHLKNIFKRNPKANSVLMPDFSFILNDWNTAHLHNVLAGLPKPERACFVEIMLIDAIQELRKSAIIPLESPVLREILNAVTEEHILKYWWSGNETSFLQEAIITDWVLKLVSFFGQAGNAKRKPEYMISYYLLDFVKTYQTSRFRLLSLADFQKPSTFYSKLAVFRKGVKLHESFNRLSDFEYLLLNPSPQRPYTIGNIDEQSKKDLSFQTFERTIKYGSIKIIAQKNEDTCKWMNENAILNYYNFLSQNWETFPRRIDKKITKLSREYSAMGRSFKALEHNYFLRFNSFSPTQSSHMALHTDRYKGPFLSTSVGYPNLRSSNFQPKKFRSSEINVNPVNRLVKEEAAKRAAYEIFGELTEIYGEITILVQHRLLHLKGLNTPLYYSRSPEMMTIFDAVTSDCKLRSWRLNYPLKFLQKDYVDNWVQKLILFFGRGENSNENVEYLITYYLLSFLKTYHTGYFTTSPFSDLQESFIFDSKLELFKEGMRLHEVVNSSSDYKYLLKLPPEQKAYLTADITDQNEKQLRWEVLERVNNYKFIRQNILAQGNEDLCSWIESNSIIQYFDLITRSPGYLPKIRRNLWQMAQSDENFIVSNEQLPPK